MKMLFTINFFVGFAVLNAISCKAQKIEIKEEKVKTEKPNIVLLFVDDYGWSDIGYRNPIFNTPNLDTLKKESLEFSRAYIPTPTCSPSRLSLLTGKEAIRLGMPRHIHIDKNNPKAEYNLWPTDPVQMPSRNYLPLKEITYAASNLVEFVRKIPQH